MENVDLVFIPSPLMGHMGQAIEFAHLLLNRFNQVSVSVLVMKLPNDPVGNAYADSLGTSTTSTRISFHYLPMMKPLAHWSFDTPGDLADLILEEQKPHVRDIVRQLTIHKDRGVAGFVVDMFCTSMVDVGKEFGVATYVFFTSGAAYLGLMLHLQTLEDKHGLDISKIKDSPEDFITPSYAAPLPPNIIPKKLMDKHCWSVRFLRYARQYREAKGIIVNTFMQLEPHALSSYDSQTPSVYPVGPLLKTVSSSSHHDHVIMTWLDNQPESSVVFLCFGSRGCFNREQVREIAVGIERSGYRFLWSLRQPPVNGAKGFPGEYDNDELNEVLPGGFLERTARIGKVIGWAPQMRVLSHLAVGGFVSHCGWDSTLESLWCGVPITTWPLYAEQQVNAHQLVKELQLGVEISLDYNQLNSNQGLVMADNIDKGIRNMMDTESKVRIRVKEMRDKSRMALKKGGSSSTCLETLLYDMIIN